METSLSPRRTASSTSTPDKGLVLVKTAKGFDLRPRADKINARPPAVAQDGDGALRAVIAAANGEGRQGRVKMRRGLLSPGERVVVLAIVNRAIATYEHIYADLYGDRRPSDPHQVVSVMMSRIRAKLKGVATIRVRRGVGFVVDDDSRAVLRMILDCR